MKKIKCIFLSRVNALILLLLTLMGVSCGNTWVKYGTPDIDDFNVMYGVPPVEVVDDTENAVDKPQTTDNSENN